MSKSKISTKDFLDLLDDQADQPSPVLGTCSKIVTSVSNTLINSSTSSQNNKEITNGVQTGNKEITNGVQTGNKESTGCVYQNEKQVTEQVTSNRVNRVQTEYKQVTKQEWETLRGHEANLLQFIFDECRATGDLLSPPLTLDRIASYLGSHKDTAKTIMFRLSRKGFVKRESSATGRGGFTRFRIEKDLYQALLIRKPEHKQVTNGVQTGNKQGTQRVTERITSLSSSSSYVLDKDFKTTTGEPELFENIQTQLSPEWLVIDFSPLSEIGFTQTHLIQIVKQGKLSIEEVQDSIYYYAFDLSRNGKGKFLNGSPLNFIMGILRKGIPYAPPENYESPADEARRKIREFKERKEREHKAEEQLLIELEFSEWRRGLVANELTRLLPEFARKPGPLQDSALKTHFETNVWPERAQEFLGLAKVNRAEVATQIEQSLGISEQINET